MNTCTWQARYISPVYKLFQTSVTVGYSCTTAYPGKEL